MIEDKNLQVKIAESPEEELWIKVKEARETSIKSMEDSIKVEKVFLKAAEEQLKKLKKS